MGERCKREGWQEERTDSMRTADVTLVREVESEPETLYSLPLGPAEGETGTGARRCGFCGVDGWGFELMGRALASGVEDLSDMLGCRDEPWKVQRILSTQLSEKDLEGTNLGEISGFFAPVALTLHAARHVGLDASPAPNVTVQLAAAVAIANLTRILRDALAPD